MNLNLLGSDLVMLHGANGCAGEMESWRTALEGEFRPRSFNLPGHAGRPLPDAFDTPGLASDVIAQMDEHGIGQAIIFGYSFGGVLALYLARHYPGRVSGVVTLATKATYDARAVRQLTFLLQVRRLEAKPARMAHLARIHQPNDWRDVVVRLNALFRDYAAGPPLSAKDLRAITCPVLVLSGATDPLISAAEASALCEALGHAELLLAPGAVHPPTVIRADGLARIIGKWARGTARRS